MKMLAKLIKINLLTFFGFYKIFNIKNKKDFKKTIPMILLYIYAFGFLGFSVYYGASFTLKALKDMELEHLLLVVAMSLSSFYLLLTTTFQVNKTLFNAKDYPLLLSLPIKKSTIILSKLFVLYFINFIFILLLMVPTYLAYINGTVQSISFHVLFWLSFFFIPIIPTIIGSLIGSLFTDVSSRFKYKNFVNILISVIFIFILFYFSYKMQNMTSIDFANLSKSLVDKLSAIYPLTTVYSNIIKETSIISLILFILISFISLYIFLLILSKFFDKINSRMNAITINNIYKDSDVKTNSPLISLYKKEVKRYLSSPMYILNTALGAIMLLGSLISIAIFGADSLDAYLQIPNLTANLTSNGPLVMCVFCALTCTTHSSISLEGKNIWILKHIPVSIKEIFFAKIMVNLTILIPTILISSFALIYLLKLPFISIFALIIIPSILALFIAGVGLLINLTYPVLNWVNEIKVIKQSMAAFLSLIVGGSVSFIPLILINKFNINIWIIGGLYLIITILVYKVLFTKGKNLFYKL